MLKEYYNNPVCCCEDCIREYIVQYSEKLKNVNESTNERDSKKYSEDLNNFLQCNTHIVWFGEFDRLFRQKNNHLKGKIWKLLPYEYPQHKNSKEIVSFKLFSKVRFLCNKCCRIWTSKSGIVIFSIHEIQVGTDSLPEENYQVRFTLCGQICINCRSPSSSAPLHTGGTVNQKIPSLVTDSAVSLRDKDTHQKYLPSIWYPSEIISVLERLHASLEEILDDKSLNNNLNKESKVEISLPYDDGSSDTSGISSAVDTINSGSENQLLSSKKRHGSESDSSLNSINDSQDKRREITLSVDS